MHFTSQNKQENSILDVLFMEKHSIKNKTSLTIKKSNADYFVEGYAMLWKPCKCFKMPTGMYYESFEGNAFDKTDMRSMVFLLDHKGDPLASIEDKTLSVVVDNKGLKVIADLSKTKESREVYRKIESGKLSKMSWSFDRGEFLIDDTRQTITHRTIKKVYDVSVVTQPANHATEIKARIHTDGAIGMDQAERLERERLKLLIDIELNS